MARLAGGLGQHRHLPHVDGLRAVAVLAVLAFHAGLPFARGGFVGVDIFFVISGFVIARLIKSEVGRDAFSLPRFWARRVRRLLPAYGPVLLFTFAVCWLVYLPDDLERVGRSAVAVSLFVSNFLFWQETGYFAAQAEVKPLLHTWSLAVEEQFYLLFPLLFPLILKSRRLPPAAWVAGIAFLSLITAEVLLRADPAAAFYLLPARAWELALGVLLVFLPASSRFPSPVRIAATVLGFAAMGFAIVCFGPATPFPGSAGLVPCVGAMAAIWGGSNLLSRRTLELGVSQFFGRISYGLYLWHWPLLAIWRYYRSNEIGITAAMLLLAAATLLAWLSFVLVERPFRTGRLRSVSAPAIALSVSGLGVAAGAYLMLANGVPQRFPAEVREILSVKSLSYRQPGCMSGRPSYRSPEDSCSYGSRHATASVALWGDSHAHALADVLGREMGRGGLGLRFLGTFACPPLIAVSRRTDGAECDRYNREALAWLVQEQSITDVVLLARHSAYLLGPLSDTQMGADDALKIELVAQADLPDRPLFAAYFARLEHVVESLTASGKRVILILPVPEAAAPVPEAMALRAVRGAPVAFDQPFSLYARRQGKIRAELLRIAAKHGAATVDPAEFLCDRRRCRTSIDGAPLYYDDDHLSQLGARILARRVIPHLGSAGAR